MDEEDELIKDKPMQTDQETSQAITNAQVQHWGEDRILSEDELVGYLVSYVRVGDEVIGISASGEWIVCMKLYLDGDE